MSAAIFQLTSPAFANGDTMPERYSCQGLNISPPLHIQGVPDRAASLALFVHDPDAPMGDYVHWTVWNMNTTIDAVPENWIPDDAIEGSNSSGHAQYMGPCPPSGTHHYIFDLYALDAPLDLPDGALEEDVRQGIADHAIAKTTLTGLFSRDGD